MLLAALPWNLIREIVLGILEEIVESTDNEYDDTLLDIVNDAIDKKEVDEPDTF
jgi:hypothetical protein